eukprot:scaffold192973_cov34-Tisochrysis_lutea.AAC.5
MEALKQIQARRGNSTRPSTSNSTTTLLSSLPSLSLPSLPSLSSLPSRFSPFSPLLLRTLYPPFPPFHLFPSPLRLSCAASQDECLADDVALPPDATDWTEEEARAYFESGGAVRPREVATSGSVAEDYRMVRWAVDTATWDPTDAEWKTLLDTLPEEDSTRVMKFHFRDDQKRAIVSRLLQRYAAYLACKGVPA